MRKKSTLMSVDSTTTKTPDAASEMTEKGRAREREDLISHLKELLPGLRPAERRVADVVLGNIEFAVHASNARLAELAEVSEPTVTRFCRTLGCKGVREFKVALAQSLVVGGMYFRELPEVQDAAVLPYWNSVLNNARNAIDRAAMQLDEAHLRASVDLIAKARRVFVFGVGGGSTALALDMQFRLFRYGITVTAYMDTYLIRMVVATLGSDDVVIVISATGRTPELIDALHSAQQYHARTIAITSPRSQLAEAADVALTVKVPETTEVLKPTASRYAFMVVVDLLATGVAYQLGQGAQETLRRIKFNLMNIRKGEIREPLGD